MTAELVGKFKRMLVNLFDDIIIIVSFFFYLPELIPALPEVFHETAHTFNFVKNLLCTSLHEEQSDHNSQK